jgi:hypothetical protein
VKRFRVSITVRAPDRTTGRDVQDEIERLLDEQPFTSVLKIGRARVRQVETERDTTTEECER